MKNYWVHYKHNGEREVCQVQSNTEKQAIHNGLGLAQRYYSDENIEFVELELITE